MLRIIIAILSILSVSGHSGTTDEVHIEDLNFDWFNFSITKYPYNTSLETFNGKKIHLFWQIQNDDIEFAVVSKNGPTWVALGVSEVGGMKGADIFVARKGDNGFVLEDRHAKNTDYVFMDDVNDLTLLNSFQSADGTAFSFKRKLVPPCDRTDEDVKIHTDIPVFFIYAIGTSNNFGQHAPGDNGKKIVDISQVYFPVEYSTPDVTQQAYVKTPKFVIPNTSKTQYCYSYHDFTDFPKTHIVKQAPMINQKMIHHIIAYTCERKPDGFDNPNTVFCQADSSSSVISNSCVRAYLLWAMGTNDIIYPSHLGKPFGKDWFYLGDKFRYIVLEVHYHNELLAAGVEDEGSGFNLTVTENLRQYDVGILYTGPVPNDIKLQAGKQKVGVTRECPSACTGNSRARIPPEGLNVMQNLFHMHNRGIGGITQIIRNGTEIEPLVEINNYDFRYQHYQFIPKNKKIYPGDRLLTTCYYNTSLDTTQVRGGYSSNNEMCINFIEFYPAIPLYQCTSLGNGPLCSSYAGPTGAPTNTTQSDYTPFTPFTQPVCNITKSPTNNTTVPIKSSASRNWADSSLLAVLFVTLAMMAL